MQGISVPSPESRVPSLISRQDREASCHFSGNVSKNFGGEKEFSHSPRRFRSISKARQRQNLRTATSHPPNFPIVRLLPQLLAAPLMVGSLFLLPASIAQVSQDNSYEGNSEMRMNVLRSEGLIIEVLIGALLGGALGGGSISFRLWNLIYRKTEKIDSDIIPLKNDLINKLQAESNVLKSKLDELSRKIEKQTEKISGDIIPLKNDLINKLQAESNMLQSKLNELQGKIEKQKESNVKVFTDSIQEMFKKIETRIGNNQTSLTISLDEVRKINNNIEDVKVDVEGIVKRLNEKS